MPTELICTCGHTKAEHEKRLCHGSGCECTRFQLQVPTLHTATGKKEK